jgi:hypothetical protein
MVKSALVVLFGVLPFGPVALPVQASEPGPSAALLGFKLGDRPSRHMHKFEKARGLDLYESPESDRVIAGREVSLVRLGFYRNRLCQIEVSWERQANVADLEQIASALTDAWGRVDRIEAASSKHMWYSPDSRISAGLWRETDISGGPAILLVLMDLPCASEAVNNSGAAPAPEPPWRDAAEVYVGCVRARVDALADADAQPSDIADAALADCGREFEAFRGALSDFFAGAVSRRAQSKARLQADEKAKEMRSDVRRSLISRVLRARESKPESAR